MERLIPVIHAENYAQVMTNVETCLRCGVNNAFIINHSINSLELQKIGYLLYESLPEFKLGFNFLNHQFPDDAIQATPYHARAVWVDNGCITPDHIHIAEKAYQERKKKSHWLMYFGGVAFKYQQQPKDAEYEWTFRKAMDLMDVICTSGDGTAIEAPLGKIERIRSIIQDKPLAIASGITAQNVKKFMPLVNYFLVASTFTNRAEYIIEAKLQELKDIIG